MTVKPAYTRTAIFMHWLMAVLVLVAFPVGIIMHEMPFSPDKLRLMSYHKWLCVTIFLLLLARLAWRATHKPAPLLQDIPQWQKTAATGVHVLLYVLLFAIPLSGWLMSSAKGFQTVYFGILPLPDLLGKDKLLADILSEVHEMLNITLLILFSAHVLAALKHHFVDHDATLVRMLPFLNRSNQK